MNLYEVGLEVIGNGLIFIRSFAVGRDAVTKLCPCQVVPGNTKPMGALFGNTDSLCQFLLQQIGFIYNPSCRSEGTKRGRLVTHSGKGQGVRSSAVCSHISARRVEWSPRSYSSEDPLPGTKRDHKRPSIGGNSAHPLDRRH